MITDFNAFQFNFIVQSCMIFTVFIALAFAFVSTFFKDLAKPDKRGARAVTILGGMFTIYILTVIISVILPQGSSPLDYDLISATFLSLVLFSGIVGITFAVLEWIPSIIQSLNCSASFTLLVVYYAIFGKPYITQLNEMFQKMYTFKQEPSSKSFFNEKDFPYYFLIHYFDWNNTTLDTAIEKVKGIGIIANNNESTPDKNIENLNSYLFQLYWVSYFLVINFAMNTALVVAYLVMMMNQKIPLFQ